MQVIDDLAGMGVPLILFSGGEPLLREDIWELARHARDRGLKMALSTNGTLITPDVAVRIRESGIEYAGISLDGATVETHDRFRNSPGAFGQTVAAFAACHEAGLRCGVRVTLTRENHRELEALVDRALELGASRFCLYWLVPAGRGIDSYSRLQAGPERGDGGPHPPLPESKADRPLIYGVSYGRCSSGLHPPARVHGAGQV